MRNKWAKDAGIANKTKLPTDNQMRSWSLREKVADQLSEYHATIDDMAAAIQAPGFGSLPTGINDAVSVLDRCKALRQRSGACVTTDEGKHVSVRQAIRVMSNIDTTGDIRGQLQRFAMQDFHKRGVIKDQDAFTAAQDIRVGENVLAVFRVGEDADIEYFVGQTRQIIASVAEGQKKKAVFTSVGPTDTSAVMLCFPWARIDVSSGCLGIADEPHEYYSVHAVRQLSSHAITGHTTATWSPLDLVDPEDDDEADPVSVAVGCSSIMLRSVGVDWQVPKLHDSQHVLDAIRSQPVL